MFHLDFKNKTPFLSTILNEVNPDLFMVCEVVDEIGSDYLFENAIIPFNEDFEKAPFEENQSGSYSLQQLVYYNSNKLILEESRVITADTRDINQYTFKISFKLSGKILFPKVLALKNCKSFH